MKVLYGTGNPAKLTAMQNRLINLPVELVSLKAMEKETGIAAPFVEERGNSPLENARQKAKAYYAAYKMPVFSCDSGLYCKELPEELQPGVHVRTVNGKSLSDEEMQQYYAGLAEKYGKLTARYHNAICFITKEGRLFERMDESLQSDAFLLTAKCHPIKKKGFPLDSLSVDIKSGRYFYDLGDATEDEFAIEDGFLYFFEEVIRETAAREREKLPTPCYVADEALIEKNLRILRGVMDRTGAKILLAQKAFSMYALYPLIGSFLSGATASGLYEARLGYEEMVLPLAKEGKVCENHVFAPAFKENEFAEILQYSDHIVFNSFAQVNKFGKKAKEMGKSIGLRINPQCSTQEGHAIYDPCAPGSRMGVTLDNFKERIKAAGGEEAFARLLGQLDGLHFHTLCEQNADDLEKTLDAVEEQFGKWLPGMKWINFGGGHHITRADYDMDRLEKCIRRMQEKYGLTVYLEPGEAVALNAGYLVTSVLEIVKNGIEIGILDTSAACHMPDVLEMPYRPPLKESGKVGEKAYSYRLAGPTCLAGDVIGDYSFDKPLKEGDRLVFEDMAIYSMVKNNTFNGMPLPAIVLQKKDGSCRIVKQFGYEDFKGRL